MSHPSFTEPARICTAALQRVEETDEDVVYGLISRGETYVFIPNITVKLPTDDDDSAANIGLSIGRYGEIVDVIRSIPMGQYPTVNVEMVMSSSPDVVEAAWPQFDLKETSIEADAITGEIGMESIDTEPGVPWGFTPAYYPGLF
ncbi:MAG: hypothetical protein AUJ49_08485 [Desulfovibrionaceae bacterium CG1_02_65_16]|nr:MAG: hypothetical protein AUJ49_08485 [Desulfovibrionaceae bacterium CG1_02_65_16]